MEPIKLIEWQDGNGSKLILMEDRLRFWGLATVAIRIRLRLLLPRFLQYAKYGQN